MAPTETAHDPMPPMSADNADDNADDNAADMSGALPERGVAIQLDGVAKDYRVGREVVPALHEVHLDIGDGEFFSLLGPSGCGKSTTLRIVAGFEEPTRGQVRLFGKDVTRVGPDKRDVNMVFQGYALFPHLSVWDNIAFGLRRKHLGRAEIRKRVDEAVHMVDLTSRVTRMPRELSGGQQQRVALARALVNRPRALLLDEPLGALDLQLRQAMQMELKRIQREAGITFVYVTHDQSEALTMSDRVAVMNAGRIEQCSDPKSLYESPATTFVAGFIGTSNLFRVPSSRLEGANAVVAAGADDQVSVRLAGDHRVGEELTFSVRPEKLLISDDRPTSGNRLRARVTDVAYLGMSTSYVVATSLLDNVVVFEKNGPSAVQHHRGDEVWLTWPDEFTHTFPNQ